MKLRSLAISVGLLVAAAVQAQTPPAPSPEVLAARAATAKACESDVKTLCAGKEGHEAMMCLRATPDKVSTGCKDSMASLAKLSAPKKP